jgi:hypothetical protein
MKDDDRTAEKRATELRDKAIKAAEAHEGNRATADADAPQPTREPTRDRKL